MITPMGTCCSSCTDTPCKPPTPRIGGTKMAFPGRVFVTRVKPSLRPGLGDASDALSGSSSDPATGISGSASGSSFWNAFGSQYQPGMFSRSFQAGLYTPTSVSQAITFPSIHVSPPASMGYGGYSVGQVHISAPNINANDFKIQTPSIGGGALSSHRSVGSGMMIGVAVLAAAAFFLAHKKKTAAGK